MLEINEDKDNSEEKNSYLNLPLHSDTEECNEVHDQDGPEDGDVEELPEGTEESYGRCLGGRIPELELWQSPNERSKLLIL